MTGQTGVRQRRTNANTLKYIIDIEICIALTKIAPTQHGNRKACLQQHTHTTVYHMDNRHRRTACQYDIKTHIFVKESDIEQRDKVNEINNTSVCQYDIHHRYLSI